MKPTNLSEYFQSIGQALPTVSERAGDAAKAGITEKYTGSVKQNAQLLSYYLGNQGPVDLGTVSFGVEPTANIPNLPQQTAPQSAPVQKTYKEQLLDDRSAIQQEIEAIEARMLSRASARKEMLDEHGVFDDLRKLNELKPQLREAENRQKEIPIEETQKLRGRGATVTEFEQRTTPKLEDAALQSLSLSSKISAYSDRINTNILVVDDYISQQREQDNLLYDLNKRRLNEVESAYKDILSAEQSAALEQAKFQNEILKMSMQTDLNFKSDVMKKAIDMGVPFDTSWNVNDIVAAIGSQSAFAEAEVNFYRTNDWLSRVDKLLTDPNLKGNVGVGIGSKSEFTKGGGRGGSDWRNEAQYLVSNASLEHLLETLSRGTFGSLSQTEQDAIAAAFSPLQIALNDKNKFNMTEEAFVREFNKLQDQVRLTVIGKVFGDTIKNQLATMSSDDIISAYNHAYQYASIPPTLSGTQNQAVTQNLIKQLEGFSTTAYPDAGGYSIGYGTQTHPDGRPVRAGDTITPAQADQYLQYAIRQHSTWQNKVNVPLDATQQAALTSFEYNLGPGVWNGEKAKQILSYVNNRMFGPAAQLMQLFVNSGGKKLQALVNRRQLEGQLLAMGDKYYGH